MSNIGPPGARAMAVCLTINHRVRRLRRLCVLERASSANAARYRTRAAPIVTVCVSLASADDVPTADHVASLRHAPPLRRFVPHAQRMVRRRRIDRHRHDSSLRRARARPSRTRRAASAAPPRAPADVTYTCGTSAPRRRPVFATVTRTVIGARAVRVARRDDEVRQRERRVREPVPEWEARRDAVRVEPAVADLQPFAVLHRRRRRRCPNAFPPVDLHARAARVHAGPAPIGVRRQIALTHRKRHRQLPRRRRRARTAAARRSRRLPARGTTPRARRAPRPAMG